VIEGWWNAWDIFTGLDPRLLHVPNGVHAKPVVEVLRKRTVVINIEYG